MAVIHFLACSRSPYTFLALSCPWITFYASLQNFKVSKNESYLIKIHFALLYTSYCISCVFYYRKVKENIRIWLTGWSLTTRTLSLFLDDSRGNMLNMDQCTYLLMNENPNHGKTSDNTSVLLSTIYQWGRGSLHIQILTNLQPHPH